MSSVNIGFKYERTMSNQLERCFADRWEKENRLLNDQDLFTQLITKTHTDWFKPNELHFAPIDSHRKLAATIFQWMGSPVGLSIVCEILTENGYQITPPKEPNQ